MFAVDSVPAVLCGEPRRVRRLLLQHLRDHRACAPCTSFSPARLRLLRFLRPALALILVLVGTKMLLSEAVVVPTVMSHGRLAGHSACRDASLLATVGEERSELTSPARATASGSDRRSSGNDFTRVSGYRGGRSRWPTTTIAARAGHAGGDGRAGGCALRRTDCARGGQLRRLSGWRLPASFLRGAREDQGGVCAGPHRIGTAARRASPARSSRRRPAVAAGELDEHFPLDVFQTGSGTSTNMNVNEVLAHLANLSLGGDPAGHRPVHPNDHVNLGQSSNDVIPAALRLAALDAWRNRTGPALAALAKELEGLAGRHRETITLGRTHLMDAMPTTYGRVFAGWKERFVEASARIETVAAELRQLPLGGTAVGHWGRAPSPAWSAGPWRCSRRSTARGCATTATARDGDRGAGLRHRDGRRPCRRRPGSAGRRQRPSPAGLRVLRRPRRAATARGATGLVDHARQGQPGHPGGGGAGGVADRRSGWRVSFHRRSPPARAFACQPFARLEPRHDRPPPRQCLRLLAERCLAGLKVDVDRCRAHAGASPALATSLASKIGYERAAEVAKEAEVRGESVAAVARRMDVLPETRLDEVLDLDRLAGLEGEGKG